ncbi:TetR/AcrR family transcriptional regulator [Desulfosporosinus fructosivorans]|uniref:TetR/AcrR family transcriptional regulator n=1 Tax=Desulfosporosinus fructosivorans TaxID=2018669 RepID=A0A4Z0R7M7_9FIRM|nr:TetR/AcrR family transcriptional regulator [Desulfosporosinus fructosivorans]TGE38534.1 TetR/AcrR family transcriptional regulator [Desulfosporosinus fructosivorans]
MYSNFENLIEDKKQRILEACIQEFADKGYEKASTNAIIKNAKISKGILFHYFGNKKNLFLYIVEYCLQLLITGYKKYPLQNSKDIFDRLLELGMVKLQIYNTNPNISKVILQAFMNSPEELRAEIQDKYQQLANEFMPSIFKDIDSSKFRDSVNPEIALEVVMLFLESLQGKYIKKYKGREQELLRDVDKIMDEYKEYVEVLKYGIYVR